jgi:hypothetical protein
MVLWKDMECWLFYYQALMSKEKICACSNGCTWSTIECADCVNLLSFDGWNPNFNYFQFLDLEGMAVLGCLIFYFTLNLLTKHCGWVSSPALCREVQNSNLAWLLFVFPGFWCCVNEIFALLWCPRRILLGLSDPWRKDQSIVPKRW